MKKFLYSILFFSIVAFGFTACDDDEVEPKIENLPINYANVSGEWQLISWRGEQMPDGVYFNINLDRRDHLFTIRQNINSMYEQELTGSYSLDLQDDEETYVLSGYYSYGKGKWLHDYIVSSISVDGRLSLVAEDDDTEVAILQKKE